MSNFDRNIELYKAWFERIYIASTAHYRASEIYKRRATILTRTNIIFAIAVLFIAHNKFLDIKLIDKFLNATGGDALLSDALLSIAGLGTVLTAVWQYISRYEERAHEHKLAGAEYSNLKRKIERQIAANRVDDDATHRLNRDYNFLGRSSPMIERKVWNAIKLTLEKHLSLTEFGMAVKTPNLFRKDPARDESPSQGDKNPPQKQAGE